jgi:hypothetical protein
VCTCVLQFTGEGSLKFGSIYLVFSLKTSTCGCSLAIRTIVNSLLTYVVLQKQGLKALNQTFCQISLTIVSLEVSCHKYLWSLYLETETRGQSLRLAEIERSPKLGFKLRKIGPKAIRRKSEGKCHFLLHGMNSVLVSSKVIVQSIQISGFYKNVRSHATKSLKMFLKSFLTPKIP